jgi:hypothetical protein
MSTERVAIVGASGMLGSMVLDVRREPRYSILAKSEVSTLLRR